MKYAYRHDIDGLRGVAVLLVIGFHLFPNYIRSGYVGVDLFFVISGYLITGIFLKDNTSIKLFYVKRIRRLYPALLTVLTLTMLTSFLILDKVSIDNLLNYLISNLIFITNIYSSYDINYFTANIIYKPLIHLWSLSIEWQFYLIFPFVIFLISKKNSINYKLLLILLIIILLIVLYIFSDGYFNSIYRFIEILCGSLVALGFLRTKVISNIYLNILLFLLIIFIDFDKTSYPNLYSIIPVLLAVNIISSSWNAYLNGRVLSNSILNYVGKISYPLYLIHWPLISLYNYKFFYSYNIYSKLIIFVISIIISILIYEFIEKSSKKFINIKLLIVYSILLIITSIYFIFNNFNISSNNIQIMDARSFNINKEWRTHECNLQADQKDILYISLSKCLSNKNTGKRYLLTGDSYAAALYPGFKDISLKNAFGYLTANSCPLFTLKDSIDLRSDCAAINDQRFKFIIENNINTVIIAANWVNYKNYLNKLNNVMEELQKRNVKIILIGQFPNWEIPLPSVLIKNNFEITSSPLFLNYGFDINIFKINKELEKIAVDNTLQFINPEVFLCDKIDQGCMALLPDGYKIRVITFDNGHLTPSASNYFYTLIKSKL